jgi:hypothetical protein
MERKKRAFYATDEEYEEIRRYAEERDRTVSNFALYAMKVEMSKTKKRNQNRQNRQDKEKYQL